MIFVDSKLEALVSESDNIKLFDFSFASGANAVISKRAYPPTEKLLGKHNEDNSIFVQVLYPKRTEEKYFIKMLEQGYKNKVVVMLGTPQHKDGYVFVCDDLWLPEADYAMMKLEWASYGTLVHECPDYLLERFLLTLHKRLVTDEVVIFKTVEPEIADDWRSAISAMPLMTRERVEFLWDRYKEGGYVDALNALTDPRQNTEGFGKIACAAIRDWMKVPDGFTLTYDYIKED